MTDEAKMRFCSHLTENQWIELNTNGNGQEESKEPQKAKAAAKLHFTEMLQAKNLIVLAGLGSSLYIDDAPKMSDLWKAVSEIESFDNIKGNDKVKYNPDHGEENVEEFLSKCHLYNTLHDGDIKDFIKEAEKIIAEKCDFVKSSSNLEHHETFLRRIARRSTKLERTKIFTINYDLCFEKAAQDIDFVVIDGFSYNSPRQFGSNYFNYDFVKRSENIETPQFIPNVFHLYKLHGSINWTRKNGQIKQTSKRDNPLLIYPRSTKYETSYKPPFLEMMGHFQSSLRKGSLALLVIGFGFNDEHITQPLLSALRSNIDLKIMIVDPSIKESDNKTKKEICKLQNSGDSRIALLEAKFEQFSELMPDLSAASEEEKHRQRIKELYKDES